MAEISVYRVQDHEGRGPFRPGFSHRWVEERPDHDNLTPWPLEFPDVLASIRVRQKFSRYFYGCGCTNLEQLRRWFVPVEYERLRRLGYDAVKINVGRILAESELQCVFEREFPLTWGAEKVELYRHERVAAHDPT